MKTWRVLLVGALTLIAAAAAAGAPPSTASSAPGAATELESNRGAGPQEGYDYPGEYAQRFDGISPEGQEIHGSETYMIVGASGADRIPVRLKEPESLRALESREGRTSSWIRFSTLPAGALPSGIEGRRLGEVRLVEESPSGSLDVRLGDVRITSTETPGAPPGRVQMFRLHYRTAQVEGDPDRPLTLGTVPNARVGRNQTSTVGADRSRSAGAAADPAPPGRAGGRGQDGWYRPLAVPPAAARQAGLPAGEGYTNSFTCIPVALPAAGGCGGQVRATLLRNGLPVQELAGRPEGCSAEEFFSTPVAESYLTGFRAPVAGGSGPGLVVNSRADPRCRMRLEPIRPSR